MAVSTIATWLKVYWEKRFDQLLPRKRVDDGWPRRIGEKEMVVIAGKCRAFPHWSVQKLYEENR
ncbi:MAG: helix-turn-helix domain-containing protein [Deltaproteobacteria bacterium]|nr:helix-turn-helix domain-containing protein [Deltaproteobacteria bacterium]